MGIKFLQNIDAERNKFEEAGFEVVEALPTTNLFMGRQVTYEGVTYQYNGSQWIDAANPIQRYRVSSAGIATSLSILNANSSQMYVSGNSQIVEIASLLGGNTCTSLFDDVITIADALIETQDADSDVWTQVSGFPRTLTLGQKLRLTASNSNDVRALSRNRPGRIFMIYIPHKWRDSQEQVTIEYLTWTNATGDGDMDNADNYIWWTVYQKTLPSTNYWIYPLNREIYPESVAGGVRGQNYIHNIRITIEMTHTNSTTYPNTTIYGCNIYTTKQVTAKTTPVYLNYDAVIKPTQSTKTYKTIEWVLQYLAQGSNWLRDNHLPLAGGRMTGNLTVPKLIKSGGTATQMLMADGSTKDISGFANSDDIPTQLPNPNPIIIKTADGVSVRYDGSASGGVILEAGDNAELTATQDSDDTMTVKFDAVVPTKLPNPQSLQIQVLDDAGAILGSDILYDGLTAKILKLVAGYGIELNSVNLTGGQAVGINLKQIAGTTLLGNSNGTTGTPQAITMAQLRTMLGSLTLNDIDVTLGDNSSYTLPCYIDYNGTRYQCRISKDATGLQIYRAGTWTTIGKFCRCSTRGTITNSNIDNWYKDTVPNYEMDESLSAALFAEDLTTKFGSSIAGTWTGKTVTLNLASVNIKDTKSAWEMLKKNMGDCFPSDSVEKIRYYYNVAIPSGEVVTKIELSYHNGVGMCTVHFYTEG